MKPDPKHLRGEEGQVKGNSAWLGKVGRSYLQCPSEFAGTGSLALQRMHFQNLGDTLVVPVHKMGK